MKNFTFILLSLIFCVSINTEAQVWRLNNQPGVSADFANLQEAIDGVTPGDTIHVEPSPFSYGNATISKKVTLIGGGYWHLENDSTLANIENSIVEVIVLEPGSEGSVLSGLNFKNSSNLTLLIINTDDIVIERNLFNGVGGYYLTSNQIRINGNRSGLIIRQNWISTVFADEEYAIYINGAPEDIIITNNIIKPVLHNIGAYSIYQTEASESMGLNVTNNVFLAGTIHTYNALHVNNILIQGIFYNGNGGIAHNNICNEEQYPPTNNNQRNVDMSTVFVDHTSSVDNGYMLKQGSPAIGAGYGGGDCGAFSSDFMGIPYVLSGMPAIPSIFEAEFNSLIFPATFETLEVNIKAKSNN